MGEISGEPVQGINLLWLDPFDHLHQVRKISMIAERKGRMRLVAVAAICIHGPAGQDRQTRWPKMTQHGGVDHVGRTNQDLPPGRAALITFVGWEALSE